MTTFDYLINAVFLFVVLRQARERELDLRGLIVPVVVMFLIARNYVHSLPTAGNDLGLVAALTGVGLGLGILCGFATHLRRGGDGVPLARVGWLAGGLLVAGIGARMAFVFAVHHGAQPAIASFSAANHIDAAAWPVALVAMALCEVTARLVTVQIRGWRLAGTRPARPGAIGAPA